MYTKLKEGEIIFYYPHTSLFDDVQHQSAFMCKNIVSKEGEDLSERFAITDDEEPMFQLCLRESLPGVYDAIKVLTHGISSAINDTMLGSEIKAIDTSLSSLRVTDSANYVVIRTVDHDAYNPNDVKLVDSALQSAIEGGALAEFYNRVTNETLTKLSATQFTSQFMTLSKRIIPLRKKTSLG